MTRIFYFSIFALAILLTSCEGNDDMLDNGGTNNLEPLVLNEPCHYKITLLDTPYNHDADNGDRICIVGSGGSINPNTGMATTIPKAGLMDMNDGYGLEISRGTLTYNATNGPRPDHVSFASMFEEGDYPFSKNAEAGYELTFMDDDGVEWSSSKGDAINNSNWLEITESISGEIGDSFFVTIRAAYSCGVANDAGEVKGCSGEFVMTFEND